LPHVASDAGQEISMTQKPKTSLGRAALARQKAAEKGDMKAFKLTSKIIREEIAKRDIKEGK